MTKPKGHTAWNKGKKGLQPWMNISGLNSKGSIPWNKGKKNVLSDTSRHLMSIAKLGKPRNGNPEKWKHNENFKQKRKGIGNPYWKGNKVGIHSLHSWIRLNYVKIKKCELCDTERENTFYDWSNKDHKYSRNRNDWWVLCRSCHMKYDNKNFGSRIKSYAQ